MRKGQTLLQVALFVMLYLLVFSVRSFAQAPGGGPTSGPSSGPTPLSGPAPAQGSTPSTKIVRVCIGDICEENKPDQVKLDCNFAYANPSNTDLQASTYVCQYLNNYSKFEKPLRLGTSPGGRCGVIYLEVKCLSQ